MAWILRRIRKITLLVLLLVLFGIYMYASSNSIYSINQVSAVYQPLTTPISTETSKKTHSIKQQLRLLSLSSNVHDGSCFHQIWHCFVTNMSQQWPQLLVEGNTAGILTEQSRIEVKKLTETFGAKCRPFFEAGQMLHPSMYSVIHSDPEHREIVTFVTQLGHDRFDRLELVLKTWTAAISATVYIPLKDVANFMRKLCKCKMLGNRSNVDIHLVLKDGDYYPLNLLRNVALNATKTPLSYLSDVDFVPANGTERMIEKLWTNNESFFDSNVLVVPAFEMLHKHVPVPKNKQQLIQLLDKGILIPARQKKWPNGHMSTNYEKWRNTVDIYSVKYTLDYEPYIVMKTSEIPQYNHIFVERFKDKSSHLLEVWAKGFQYQVLSTSYAVHYPHSYSDVRSRSTLYECVLIANKLFQAGLKKKYKITSIPPYIKKS